MLSLQWRWKITLVATYESTRCVWAGEGVAFFKVLGSTGTDVALGTGHVFTSLEYYLVYLCQRAICQNNPRPVNT